MTRAYSILCWILGITMILFGILFMLNFLQSIAPDGRPAFPFPIGPQGMYFVAFSGSCLIAWGGCLVGAARGHGPRAVGTATSVGLTLSGVYRMLVWFLGDFAWAGELPRIEAALFLALAFLWLRPASHAPETV